jgi:hypothetical protein
MGSEMARDLEEKLGMPIGTLDNPPLVARLESADAATKALVELALADPDSALPAGLSPSVRAMVDMARSALRAELKNADSGS